MRRMVLTLGSILFAFHAFASTANADAWSDSYSPDTGERFIPIELWTGMPWDGSRDLASTKATPKKDQRVKISGPEDYTRPTTGEMLKVYRRVNKKKVQLFTVTLNKDGLGRVFDNRRNRNCIDEVKFPLGLWRQGESREFHIKCELRHRSIRVTIEDIDFTYRGVAHSLKYRWVVDGGKKKYSDNSYIYSPNKGNVRVITHSN